MGDPKYDQQAFYKIRVASILDQDWSAWFGGMEVIAQSNGDTLLAGPIRDQAALHGVLAKVRDMGLVLLSVQRL
jgi:hypothetical protein